MKKLKLHWPQRLRLPRKWKIARNILIAMAMIVIALSAMEWPSLTMRGAYRQQEGKLLLDPSEIVYTHKNKREAVFITQGDGWISAGVVEKMSYSNSLFRKNYAVIQYIVSDEELAVLPLSSMTKNEELVVAVHGFPEQTAGAQLEIDLFGIEEVWYNDAFKPVDETITAQAQLGEDGWLFFVFGPHDHDPHICALEAMWGNTTFPFIGLDAYAYRLQFMDEAGNVIDTVSGTLPEANFVNL